MILKTIDILLFFNFLAEIHGSEVPKITEKGTPGSCSSLNEFLNVRNNSDFIDLEHFPLSNYRIKYMEKGKNLGGKYWKTRGWVYCKRVPAKNALPEDRSAYTKGYKNLPKSKRRGRFMCINGEWSARWRNEDGKWGIMTCPDYRVEHQWVDSYGPNSICKVMNEDENSELGVMHFLEEDNNLLEFSKDAQRMWNIENGIVNVTFLNDESSRYGDKPSFYMSPLKGPGGSRWIGFRTLWYKHLNKEKPFQFKISFNFKWVNNQPIRPPGKYLNTGVKIYGQNYYDIFDMQGCLENWCEYEKSVFVDWCVVASENCDFGYSLLIFDSFREKVEMVVNDFKIEFCSNW